MSAADRAYIASNLYLAVEMFFAHRVDVPTLNLDSTYRAFLDRALAARDRQEFDYAAMEFMATLRNGHTFFVDKWLSDHAGAPLGFRAQMVEGRWVVTTSTIDALRPGAELVAIDGEPFETFYRRFRRYLNWSTERAARRGLFSRPFLFPAQFTLTVADVANRPPIQVMVTRGAAPAVRRPTVESRWLKAPRVAYLRIAGFGRPEYQDSALAALAQYRDAEAIVIDVRGNGGGSTPEPLIQRLMDRPFRSWRESTPEPIALFDFYHEHGIEPFNDMNDLQLSWTSPVTPPDSAAYRGRIVLLTDAGCFSACEDFVMPFRDNGRAIVVGDTTGGSTGQPYLRDFGNGMQFGVGTKRETFPNGQAFEGVGIAPNEYAPLTRAALRSGADTALAVALRTLGVRE